MSNSISAIEWTWYNEALGYQKLFTTPEVSQEELIQYLNLSPQGSKYDKVSLKGTKVSVGHSTKLVNVRSIVNRHTQTKTETKLAVYVHGRGSRYVYK